MMESTPDYNFIQGWQGDQAIGVTANSSDTAVRTPGLMKPHKHRHASLTDAGLGHRLALRKVGAFRTKVMSPTLIPNAATESPGRWSCGAGPPARRSLRARPGCNSLQVWSIRKCTCRSRSSHRYVIGPKDGNHSCDLTAINLKSTRAYRTGILRRTYHLTF